MPEMDEDQLLRDDALETEIVRKDLTDEEIGVLLDADPEAQSTVDPAVRSVEDDVQDPKDNENRMEHPNLDPLKNLVPEDVVEDPSICESTMEESVELITDMGMKENVQKANIDQSVNEIISIDDEPMEEVEDVEETKNNRKRRTIGALGSPRDLMTIPSSLEDQPAKRRKDGKQSSLSARNLLISTVANSVIGCSGSKPLPAIHTAFVFMTKEYEKMKEKIEEYEIQAGHLKQDLKKTHAALCKEQNEKRALNKEIEIIRRKLEEVQQIPTIARPNAKQSSMDQRSPSIRFSPAASVQRRTSSMNHDFDAPEVPRFSNSLAKANGVHQGTPHYKSLSQAVPPVHNTLPRGNRTNIRKIDVPPRNPILRTRTFLSDQSPMTSRMGEPFGSQFLQGYDEHARLIVDSLNEQNYNLMENNLANALIPDQNSGLAHVLPGRAAGHQISIDDSDPYEIIDHTVGQKEIFLLIPLIKNVPTRPMARIIAKRPIALEQCSSESIKVVIKSTPQDFLDSWQVSGTISYDGDVKNKEVRLFVQTVSMTSYLCGKLHDKELIGWGISGSYICNSSGRTKFRVKFHYNQNLPANDYFMAFAMVVNMKDGSFQSSAIVDSLFVNSPSP